MSEIFKLWKTAVQERIMMQKNENYLGTCCDYANQIMVENYILLFYLFFKICKKYMQSFQFREAILQKKKFNF